MQITNLISRRAPLLAATLTAGLLLAACGSSSTGSSRAASSGTTGARVAGFIACLKAHGVTPPANFGRFRRGATGPSGPAGAAGGGLLFGGSGRRPGGPGGLRSNPKLAGALQACGGGFFRNRASAAALARFRAQRQAAIKSFVSCVAKHGFTLPAPNFTAGKPVLPASLRTNAKFLAAAKPCEGLLQAAARPGGFGGGPPGAGPPPGAGAAPA